MLTTQQADCGPPCLSTVRFERPINNVTPTGESFNDGNAEQLPIPCVMVTSSRQPQKEEYRPALKSFEK
jgi:hypothetical protein